MKFLSKITNENLLWIVVALIFICALTSCSSAKVYKQETHKTRSLVIQPCNQCDQDGGIYLYEIMSRNRLPKPPSVKSVPGAISIYRNSDYSYLIAVSPLYDQNKLLKKVSKLIY